MDSSFCGTQLAVSETLESLKNALRHNNPKKTGSGFVSFTSRITVESKNRNKKFVKKVCNPEIKVMQLREALGKN